MIYSDFVRRLAKSGEAIREEMTPEGAHLLHMALGLAGEAGELVDAIKKHVIYGKVLDIDNVIEELGDADFYKQGILNAIDVTQEEVTAKNMAKLKKRYGDGYTDGKAQARADKN